MKVRRTATCHVALRGSFGGFFADAGAPSRNPLARWFGIPDQELDIVAPSIDNFVVRDLDFML